VGHSFDIFSGGTWKRALGWMDPGREDFGGSVGKRWLANVDVPDLELFPGRYSVSERVRFQAGLELFVLHFALVGMAQITKLGIVGNWSHLTSFIVAISKLFDRFGTDNGGMIVSISGEDIEGEQLGSKWMLYADHGVGPQIPIISALIIARKLLTGDIAQRGAVPCLGLFSLEDFKTYAEAFGLRYRETHG
jgi:hypothetical protein